MTGDPWNPGIQSHIPAGLLQLSTIFRPENVFTSLAAAQEFHGLTGIALCELVAFRPERLALHEVLIRVTADFVVPDGSRIEDLGINFREITALLLERYVEPGMPAIRGVFEAAQRGLRDAVEAALEAVRPQAAAAPSAASARNRWFGRFGRQEPGEAGGKTFDWGVREIAACERRAAVETDALAAVAFGTLARVMSGLFNTHGQAWGTRAQIVQIACDIAGNPHASDAIGAHLEPLLRRAAALEGFALLPRQDLPVVINTKGPSAAGKSSLRPLHRKLAGDTGLNWSDFALISPDIWRKQLLDYGSLGSAYKYAGAFTGEELQIIDQKLDRYMARKQARGEMSHLLIDRFRFGSFAPDSAEAGSNLLTRFGQTIHLFFIITAPESLVERAWHRGLEFGRYKAVDDTLAHSVEAYSGMTDVFFTWVRRKDKTIRFEFLDNSVRLGEPPRTVAFGDNTVCNLLDPGGILNIERYRRVNINATGPGLLYKDRNLLAPEHNMGMLKGCIAGFPEVNFADQATGRIYLRIRAGMPVAVDREGLESAMQDPDTEASIRMVAPAALTGNVAAFERPQRLADPQVAPLLPTLGQWGYAPGSTG
jgi:hypothetical protein